MKNPGKHVPEFIKNILNPLPKVNKQQVMLHKHSHPEDSKYKKKYVELYRKLHETKKELKKKYSEVAQLSVEKQIVNFTQEEVPDTEIDRQIINMRKKVSQKYHQLAQKKIDLSQAQGLLASSMKRNAVDVDQEEKAQVQSMSAMARTRAIMIMEIQKMEDENHALVKDLIVERGADPGQLPWSKEDEALAQAAAGDNNAIPDFEKWYASIQENANADANMHSLSAQVTPVAPVSPSNETQHNGRCCLCFPRRRGRLQLRRALPRPRSAQGCEDGQGSGPWLHGRPRGWRRR